MRKEEEAVNQSYGLIGRDVEPQVIFAVFLFVLAENFLKET